MFISGLLFSQAAMCVDAGWLQGFYYDSMNKGNIKEGIRVGDNNSTRHDFPNVGYADVEAGEAGQKVTVGAGWFVGETPGKYPALMARFGISYAHFRTQKLAGGEAVFSAGKEHVPSGLSLKIGLYAGLHGTPSRFMVGLGFGM